jgi:hypothetical protein
VLEEQLMRLYRYVLEQILSGEPTEIVVEHIHEYLTNIGGDVRNGSIKLDEFIIFKVRVHAQLLARACILIIIFLQASGQKS